MRKVFEDEFKMYGKKEYKNLSKYLTDTSIVFALQTPYKEKSLTVGRTISVSRSIGIRKKPQPNGKPGYIRADTVHQGDLDGVKGVYHVNLVDEVTQWEILICVDSITEKSMAYVLHQALQFFHLPSSVFTPIMEERISTEASVSSFKTSSRTDEVSIGKMQ